MKFIAMASTEHEFFFNALAKNRDKGGRQCGSAMVEMALILPVFLLLAFGILYFSIYFFTQQSLENAAQQGANAAVVVDADSAGADLSSLVLARVNGRVAASLSFLPGQIGALQTGSIDAGLQCGSGAGSGFVCITDPGDGGYDVEVRLTPKFSSLWPGFPHFLFYLTGGDGGSDRLDVHAHSRLTGKAQGGDS